jgi:UDP-N-acetylmuramoylalanine--D-glutamate ligase
MGIIEDIVCLPETGHKTADALAGMDCKATVVKVKDLPEAVEYATANTKWGKACIMSPAAASYNVYRDFEEKGSHFKQLVANKQ